MTKIASADIVIFGGGIAGLWLLSRLRQAGYSAILLESGALGGGQTHKSQGIIHGGLKYALQGVLTNDAEEMVDMPSRWRDCLAGKGELDLSQVNVLSEKHYLWSPSKFTSKIAGFFASRALSSKVDSVAKEQFPAVFQHPSFKGDVFALDELVLDVPSLVRELVKAHQDVIFKIEPLSSDGLKFNEDGQLHSATVYLAGKSVEIIAQQFVFTAGAGNEVILKRLESQTVAMQRRPLHMVMVKTPFDYPLYAHCMGLGPRPRITITTHHTQDGASIWYLGGQIAEDGVYRDSASQIITARDELRALFPWLDFNNAQFETFMVDRAEPLQKNGLKPTSSFVSTVDNMLIAWPTKLALAPKLADDVMQQLKQKALSPQYFDTRELRAWPMPPLAQPIWEDVFCKNVA